MYALDGVLRVYALFFDRAHRDEHETVELVREGFHHPLQRVHAGAAAAANQEHGIVSRSDGTVDADIEARFPIGSLLRILPNHACATGAQFSAYHLIDNHGGLQKWDRFSGW